MVRDSLFMDERGIHDVIIIIIYLLQLMSYSGLIQVV